MNQSRLSPPTRSRRGYARGIAIDVLQIDVKQVDATRWNGGVVVVHVGASAHVVPVGRRQSEGKNTRP